MQNTTSVLVSTLI